jgi:hypothetical protein
VTNRLRPLVAALCWVALAGCDSRPAPGGPCSAQPEGATRDACLFQQAQALAGDLDALRAYIDGVPEPVTRDLLRLRLVASSPSLYQPLCEDVSTAGAKTRCRRVLDRPHLGDPRP